MCNVHTETAILNALFLTLFTASPHLHLSSKPYFKLKGNPPVSQDILYPLKYCIPLRIFGIPHMLSILCNRMQNFEFPHKVSAYISCTSPIIHLMIAVLNDAKDYVKQL